MSKLRNRIQQRLERRDKHSPCVNETHGMGRYPRRTGRCGWRRKPQPNAGSPPRLQSGRLTVRIEKVNHAVNRGTVQHRIEEVVKM